MANATKRKIENGFNGSDHDISKKQKTSPGKSTSQKPNGARKPVKIFDEDDAQSDFDGFTSEEELNDGKEEPQRYEQKLDATGKPEGSNNNKSRESHQKQKELTAFRKASKSNADDIARAKKLWERLRRKSHVQKDEREKLVAELFGLVSGRVKDFVFKHDSVRVIQCAVKYANRTQKQQIAGELKGDFKTLAESRYGKHLLAKLITEGDDETRKIIIPEFYGHVRRMINHPEASWILDDIYRTVATKQQKAVILREFYGPEFAVFKQDNKSTLTIDLGEILKTSPEKRQPILQYLHERINQLVQKKMTGFTILHDAMLQYFRNVPLGSEDFGDFLRLIIGDKDEEETDLLKNLAFTESGSELVCLVFAHSAAKDRRRILKSYNEVFETLAYDKWGYRVLLTAFALMDDTREISQRIFSELVLFKKGATAEPATGEQIEKICNLAMHQIGHVSILYPFIGIDRKLLSPSEYQFMQKIQETGKTTSKKDPELRRNEHILAISQLCLDSIAEQATDLISNSFGCIFMTQVLLHGQGDKQVTLEAIANSAAPIPEQEYETQLALLNSPHAGKMLKTLITGGQFDKTQNRVVIIEDLQTFRELFIEAIRPKLKDWVSGDGGFVVLALLHVDWDDQSEYEFVKKTVQDEKKQLEKAVKAGIAKDADHDVKRKGMVAGLLLKELAK